MMRDFLIFGATVAAVAGSLAATVPALAEQFQAAGPVRQATIFPNGAMVTREVQIDLPAGTHQLIIPGLPDGFDPGSLRVVAEGASVGAVGLQQQRALPDAPNDTPEITAAEDDLRRLETALAERDVDVARIRAKGDAAKDTIAFLMNLAQSETAGAQDIAAISGAVGAQLLQARQTIIASDAEARTASQGRDTQAADVERARARLLALRAPGGDKSALVVTVQSTGGPATLRITNMTDNASWRPVYDAALSRDTGAIRLDRGLLVAQSSGEDWANVHIILSTAQPMQGAAPGELAPMMPRIGEHHPELYSRSATAEARLEDMVVADSEGASAAMPAPNMAAAEVLTGQVVTYDYGTPVDLRDGADALRLTLETRELASDVMAEAVPRLNQTAYMVADTTNSTGALLLPGEATFYADGAMVGRGTLPLIAAGDKMTMGFGPLNGLLVTRDLPDQTEGGTGFIARSDQREETAILRVKNLTGEAWPLRVIDQVPVSTQKDLRIDWSASPAPDVTDPDGKRGILVWNSTIDGGATQDISLTTTLRWPEGQEITGFY